MGAYFLKVDQLTYKLFLIWYFIGVILLGFDLLPSYLEWANVVFLVLAGIIGGIYFVKTFGRILGLIVNFLVIFITIFVEHLGVEYGLLFGDYYYTTDFGPQVLGVPVAIGFTWLMVMAGSHAISIVLTGGNRFLPFIITGSLLAVLFDLIIDPVAFKVKQYWVWNAESFYYNIPMSNFIGWFVVALLLHSIIFLFSFKTKLTFTEWHSHIVLVFYLVIGMFVFLALIHGLWLSVFVTSTLSFVSFIFYMRNRSNITL